MDTKDLKKDLKKLVLINVLMFNEDYLTNVKERRVIISLPYDNKADFRLFLEIKLLNFSLFVQGAHPI